jgi:hypothetical protein
MWVVWRVNVYVVKCLKLNTSDYKDEGKMAFKFHVASRGVEKGGGEGMLSG